MIDVRTHAAREGQRLVDAAARDLTAVVPGVPAWTTTALLDHVSAVLGFVAPTVRARAAASRPAPRADGTDPVAFARAALDDVVAALAGLDPDEPCWNWSVAPDTGAFWHRRMAQELLVHRLDAERAVADPTPVDPVLAADGVAEALEVFLPRVHGRVPLTLRGEVRLEQADGPGAWQVRFDGGPQPGTGRPDVTARGPAEDLLLCVWGRQGWDVLDLTGDRALLAAWADEVNP